MLQRIWNKCFNRENVSYLIFGVLTTLADWISYRMMRLAGMDYRLATAGSWAVAVLFAFVTNKLFVFGSMSLRPAQVWKEFVAFVACRVLTGVLTLAAMVVMVDGIGIQNDFFCKIVVSALSLVMNYILSKWFIFKETS
mgnify:CR=1 FL=1